MLKSFIKALKSQVGRKVLSSVTGLGLILYITLHLAGNLLILQGPQVFNLYANGLHELGWFLHALEVVLAICFALHAYVGISVWMRRQKHRPEGYDKYQSKEGNSHNNWLSRGMLYSGLIILAFLIWHILQFRQGYFHTNIVMIDGQRVHDLRALVVSTFQQPWFAGTYAFVMVVLGFHLFHGFWSAFKSLSMKEGGFSSFIYGLGIFFAAVIAIGFLFIPLFIYFTSGG